MGRGRLYSCKWVIQHCSVPDWGPTVPDHSFTTMEEEAVAGPGKEVIWAVGRGQGAGHKATNG